MTIAQTMCYRKMIFFYFFISNIFTRKIFSMKFGKVDDPENIDFTIPPDHPGNKKALSNFEKPKVPNLYVFCAKWN